MAQVEILRGGHNDSVTCLDLKDTLLVSGGEDGAFACWDLKTHQLIKNTKLPSEIAAVCLTKISKERVFVASDDRVHCFDLANLDSPPLFTMENLDDAVNSLSLSAKEEHLALATDEGTIQVFNTSDGSPFKRLRKHDVVAYVARFHPRKPWDIASGGYDTKVIFWDLSRGSKRFIQDFSKDHLVQMGAVPIMMNPPYVISLAWGNRDHLACGLNNGAIALFHVRGKTPTFCSLTDLAHRNGVTQVCFLSPDDTSLLSSGNDGLLVLWSVGENGKLVRVKEINHRHKVNSFVVSGTQIAVADVTSHIALYDLTEWLGND